jgi:ribosomal protein S18 acetylase RimI-like enzyme
MDDVTVRRATVDDVDELSTLAHRLFLGAYLEHPKMPGAQLKAYADASFGRDVVADLLADDAVVVGVAVQAGRMMGLVVSRIAPPPPPNRLDVPAVEIWRLYVDPEVQGAGLGRRLLEWSEAQAVAHGARATWLAVWEHNEPALAFYDRLGFSRLGTTDFKLDDEDQHDLVLTRPLEV